MERDNGGLHRYSLIVVVFIEIGTAFSDGCGLPQVLGCSLRVQPLESCLRC